MPRKITVTFEDGTSHIYDGVPEEVTPEQIQERAAKDFSGLHPVSIDRGALEAPKEDATGPVSKTMKPEDYPEYAKLVKDPATTPETLAGWADSKGYGKPDLSSLANLLEFHRDPKNAKIEPANHYTQLNDPLASSAKQAQPAITLGDGTEKSAPAPQHWGLDPETLQMLGYRNINDPHDDIAQKLLHYIGNIPADVVDLAARGAQGMQAGIDNAASAADYAFQGSALDKAVTSVMGVHQRPSELIGGLPDAFPMELAGRGPMETGGIDLRATPLNRLLPATKSVGEIQRLDEEPPVYSANVNTKHSVDAKAANENELSRTLSPANDTSSPDLIVPDKIEGPNTSWSRRPVSDKVTAEANAVSDRLDHLENLVEKFPNHPNVDEWNKEIDILSEKEGMLHNKMIKGPEIPNDNAPDTPESLFTEASDKLDKHYEDPRADLDRRFKARKDWEKERQVLEDQHDKAQEDYVRSLPSDDLTRIVQQHKDEKGFGFRGQAEWSKTAEDELTKRETAKTSEPEAPSVSPAGTPPSLDETVSKVTKAINNASKIQATVQKGLYSDARAARLRRAEAARQSIGGEEGINAYLKELKGPLPKASFEAIRDQFNPEEINSLYKHIDDNKNLQGFDKGKAQIALRKLFDGEVVQSSEVKLLDRVFPPSLTKALISKRGLMAKLSEGGANLVGTARQLQTTFDLSFPFTQGWTAIGHKEFWQSFKPMLVEYVKTFKNPNAFHDFMESMKADPMYQKLESAGVHFPEHEENYQSGYATRLPILGLMVKASDHAYSAFANNLRFQLGKKFIEKGEQLKIAGDPGYESSVARMVNTLTGRGDLGKLEPAGNALGTALYSPRYMASRFNTVDPRFWANLHPEMRKEFAKSVVSAGAIGIMATSVAAAAGYKVVTDPKSSDFGSILVGDTSYNLFGRYTQLITLGARLYNNETTNGKGVTKQLGGKYGSQTRADVVVNYFANKAAPIPGVIWRSLKGKEIDGSPFNPADEALGLITPMYPNDVYQISKKDPVLTAIIKSVPGLFGIPMSTYDRGSTPKKTYSKNGGVSGQKPE